MEYQHVNHNHQSLPRTLHSLPLRTCRDRTWRKLLGKHMQYHVNPEACHLPISHWQHCSLAVHIPVPEAIRIMSEECTRLPKKTPMKITDIMLPGNWRTKWNLLEIMYAGPSQSRALADPMDHLPLQSQNCTRTLMWEKKSYKKSGQSLTFRR